MEGNTQAGKQVTESQVSSSIDPQTTPAEAVDTTTESSSMEVRNTVSSNQAANASGPVPSGQGSIAPGPHHITEASMFPVQNTYAPQAYYYGAYERPVAEWEEYPRYVNMDGMEIPSQTVYNENGSVLYHPGYAYAPQMPYGAYGQAASPVTTVRPEGQFYGPQHFQYPAPFYQQPVPSGVQYVSSPTPMSQGDLSVSVITDQSFSADGSNANFVNGSGMSVTPRTVYPVTYGSVGRGPVLPVPNMNAVYQDTRNGYDGNRRSGPWIDPPRTSDSQHYNSSVVTGVISQPPHALGPYGQNLCPVPHVMPHMQGTHQQRATAGVGPASATFDRAYSSSSRVYPQVNNFGRSTPGFGGNGRTWMAVDKSKSRGRGNGSSCSCIGTADVLHEQNRGPRTARFRNQSSSSGGINKEQGLTANGNNGGNNVDVDRDLYNRPDFVTNYSDAKFFIIKSYSEDNIHKSIKYGVWASTANGNNKLDAAFKEAQGKPDGCPVFLFFSVNASGQFCGVAEMTGPVDFEKNVDFWQQDKWSGQFPVRWHVVKDVPNSQFRHIILDNNDNKPVTNSRDTQEVKLEQGIEMLNRFKNYVWKTSILDDFQFYEAREKAMQEKRSRQEVPHQVADELDQDRDDLSSGSMPAELSTASLSSGNGVQGEQHITLSIQRLVLEESTGDALKPTADTISATQAGAEDNNSELND